MCASCVQGGSIFLADTLDIQSRCTPRCFSVIHSQKKYLPKQKHKNRATTLQSHVAHFKHIQCNRAQAACRDYERLLRADRGADPRFLAGLVLSAADCDMAAAELWAGRMENVETLLSRAKSKEAMEGVRTSLAGKIDVDLLESRPFANVSNPIRSGTKGGEIKGVGDVKTEEKKRRKRKKIMPKSFDPNVVPDPGKCSLVIFYRHTVLFFDCLCSFFRNVLHVFAFFLRQSAGCRNMKGVPSRNKSGERLLISTKALRVQ